LSNTGTVLVFLNTHNVLSLFQENYNLKQQNQVYPDTNSQRCQVANILKLFEDKVLKAVAFAKNIPGFRDLLLDDQASLIKGNFYIEVCVRICLFYNKLLCQLIMGIDLLMHISETKLFD
jgi:hypothetical protein